ncbi:DUF3060 domain-containing protein [Microbacterium sp. GXF7504]
MMNARRSTAVAAVLAALLLSGCNVIAEEPRATRLPSDARTTSPAPSVPSPSVVTPSPSTPSVTGDALDCGGRPVQVTAGAASVLVGDCPEIEAQGSGLVLNARDAAVGILRISGDRIVATAGVVGQVVLAGNDIALTADEISSLTVRGDRNTVAVSGTAAGVLVQGNDNTVAGDVTQLDDQGARNTVG